MKNNAVFLTVTLFIISCYWGAAANAGQVDIPNTFASGTPAVAAEVNANFGEVGAQINDNDSRITLNTGDIEALQSVVTALQETVNQLQGDLDTANTTIGTLQTALANKADAGHHHDSVYAPATHSHAQSDIDGLSSTLDAVTGQISSLSNSDILALDPYVTVDMDSRGPIATFSGINLKLVNGEGNTETANGLGNLIIGYDASRDDSTFFCSGGGEYGNPIEDETNCLSGGWAWGVSHKTGSHYLVIGDQNNYSRYGGLVVGYRNTSKSANASIVGGSYNTASALDSVVSGGTENTASGKSSSVSGGNRNIASGEGSSISGGYTNTASGLTSSVLGGNSQAATAGDETIPALP